MDTKVLLWIRATAAFLLILGAWAGQAGADGIAYYHDQFENHVECADASTPYDVLRCGEHHLACAVEDLYYFEETLSPAPYWDLGFEYLNTVLDCVGGGDPLASASELLAIAADNFESVLYSGVGGELERKAAQNMELYLAAEGAFALAMGNEALFEAVTYKWAHPATVTLDDEIDLLGVAIPDFLEGWERVLQNLDALRGEPGVREPIDLMGLSVQRQGLERLGYATLERLQRIYMRDGGSFGVNPDLVVDLQAEGFWLYLLMANAAWLHADLSWDAPDVGVSLFAVDQGGELSSHLEQANLLFQNAVRGANYFGYDAGFLFDDLEYKALLPSADTALGHYSTAVVNAENQYDRWLDGTVTWESTRQSLEQDYAQEIATLTGIPLYLFELSAPPTLSGQPYISTPHGQMEYLELLTECPDSGEDLCPPTSALMVAREAVAIEEENLQLLEEELALVMDRIDWLETFAEEEAAFIHDHGQKVLAADILAAQLSLQTKSTQSTEAYQSCQYTTPLVLGEGAETKRGDAKNRLGRLVNLEPEPEACPADGYDDEGRSRGCDTGALLAPYYMVLYLEDCGDCFTTTFHQSQTAGIKLKAKVRTHKGLQLGTFDLRWTISQADQEICTYSYLGMDLGDGTTRMFIIPLRTESSADILWSPALLGPGEYTLRLEQTFGSASKAVCDIKQPIGQPIQFVVRSTLNTVRPVWETLGTDTAYPPTDIRQTFSTEDPEATYFAEWVSDDTSSHKYCITYKDPDGHHAEPPFCYDIHSDPGVPFAITGWGGVNPPSIPISGSSTIRPTGNWTVEVSVDDQVRHFLTFRIQNLARPNVASHAVASRLDSETNPQPLDPSGTFSTEAPTLVSWIQWAAPLACDPPEVGEIGTLEWEWYGPDGLHPWKCTSAKTAVQGCSSEANDYITYSVISVDGETCDPFGAVAPPKGERWISGLTLPEIGEIPPPGRWEVRVYRTPPEGDREFVLSQSFYLGGFRVKDTAMTTGLSLDEYALDRETEFPTDAPEIYAWLLLEEVEQGIDLRFIWENTDTGQSGTEDKHLADSGFAEKTAWSWLQDLVLAPAEPPHAGLWKVTVRDVTGGGDGEMLTTLQFRLGGYELSAGPTLAKALSADEPPLPINVTYDFSSQDDTFVVSWVELTGVKEYLTVKWDWYAPGYEEGGVQVPLCTDSMSTGPVAYEGRAALYSKMPIDLADAGVETADCADDPWRYPGGSWHADITVERPHAIGPDKFLTSSSFGLDKDSFCVSHLPTEITSYQDAEYVPIDTWDPVTGDYLGVWDLARAMEEQSMLQILGQLESLGTEVSNRAYELAIQQAQVEQRRNSQILVRDRALQQLAVTVEKINNLLKNYSDALTLAHFKETALFGPATQRLLRDQLFEDAEEWLEKVRRVYYQIARIIEWDWVTPFAWPPPPMTPDFTPDTLLGTFRPVDFEAFEYALIYDFLKSADMCGTEPCGQCWKHQGHNFSWAEIELCDHFKLCREDWPELTWTELDDRFTEELQRYIIAPDGCGGDIDLVIPFPVDLNKLPPTLLNNKTDIVGVRIDSELFSPGDVVQVGILPLGTWSIRNFDEDIVRFSEPGQVLESDHPNHAQPAACIGDDPYWMPGPGDCDQSEMMASDVLQHRAFANDRYVLWIHTTTGDGTGARELVEELCSWAPGDLHPAYAISLFFRVSNGEPVGICSE